MQRSWRARGALIAAVSALAAPALSPPTAGAIAGGTVTGDHGESVPLNPSGAVTIRNMAPSVSLVFAPGEGFFSEQIVDPLGVPAGLVQTGCAPITTAAPNRVDYHRNGTYADIVTTYGLTDFACATPRSTVRLPFTINASVGISRPAATLQMRRRHSSVRIRQDFAIAGNPGAGKYEARFARGAQIGPDGGIVGSSTAAEVDVPHSKAVAQFAHPGAYVIVARALTFQDNGGAVYHSPWSEPVGFDVVAPFDLQDAVFTDRTAPGLRVRAVIKEPSIRGTVSVAIARGRKGGTFRSLGRARIRANGVVITRFTLGASGDYRLRYGYRGSSIVTRGSAVQPFAITSGFGNTTGPPR